jgi:hypothetical protein
MNPPITTHHQRAVHALTCLHVRSQPEKKTKTATKKNKTTCHAKKTCFHSRPKKDKKKMGACFFTMTIMRKHNYFFIRLA